MKRLRILHMVAGVAILFILVFLPCAAVAAENLVKNPSFEDWAEGIPAHWTTAEGAIQRAEKTDAHSGEYALVLGDFQNKARVFQDVAVVPRASYKFSSWQKYPGPSSYTQVSVLWLDEASNSLSVWNKNSFENSLFSTEFKIFTYGPLVSPMSAAFARIQFIKPGWGVLYVDDVSFTLTPRPPIADFRSPQDVKAGQTVDFISSSYVPDGGTITSAIWNFCGILDLPGSKVTYTFPPPATSPFECRVRLTVTSSDGLTNTTTKSVTVHAGTSPAATLPAGTPSENIPPVASFSEKPAPQKAPLTVTFDGKASRDPDGTIVSYSWDFGDGLRPGPTVSSYKFTRPGTYQVTLIVKDNDGVTNSLTKTIKVAELYPPEPIFTATPSAGPPPLQVKLDASESGDPDGSISAYRWDFGDGSPPVSDIITSHTFTRDGTYLVTLTLTDNGGLTNSLTKAIFVGKISPPVAAFTATYLGDSPPFTMSFDASESGKTGGNITAYLWDFGDNSPGVAGMKISHQYLNPGTYRVNLTVLDNAGLTNSIIRSVDVQTPINFTLFIGAGIVIIVVAAILFLLWWIPRLQLIPKQGTVPANGTSNIPIRVQFINAFKQEKRMGKDTEVKLRATSGTIQNVTVLKGQSHADARITSSPECGSVTVTGESDHGKAECTVEFTCTDATFELSVKPAEIPGDGKSVATITIRAKDPSGSYLTFLKDRTVELTSTAGTITSPTIFPAKAPGVNVTIASEKKSGVITVTAVSLPLKGEGKITFLEPEKRFCMHCGTQIELEAKKCPKCGKIPPSGVDIKQCPACNNLVPASALYCAWCGARQVEKDEKGKA